MIGTAAYLMFLVWISVEHTKEVLTIGQMALMLWAGMCCLMYDVKTWGKE